MLAGSPANQSGMKTRYFSAPAVARISAPCRVWGKKPKMSNVTTMAFFASAGPVTSARKRGLVRVTCDRCS